MQIHVAMKFKVWKKHIKKVRGSKEIQVVILEKAGGPMLYGGLKPRIFR